MIGLPFLAMVWLYLQTARSIRRREMDPISLFFFFFFFVVAVGDIMDRRSAHLSPPPRAVLPADFQIFIKPVQQASNL